MVALYRLDLPSDSRNAPGKDTFRAHETWEVGILQTTVVRPVLAVLSNCAKLG